MHVQANGLGKTFTSRFRAAASFTALDDVTFEVQPGEILAFLGPNGAGKTTTINLLMGFLTPTRGEARLFGFSPSDQRARTRLGFLPEHYAFYSFLSARRLLHYFGRLHGIEKGERTRRVDDLLEKLGLTEARDRAVGKYSRGMRQRVGIAQALINRPELLILDEPTSGFDPVGRRMVRDLLLELKQQGTAVFLSSHILSEVESICDRVIIIDRGRIVRQGTLEEVIAGSRGVEMTFRDDGGAVAAALQALGLSPVEPGRVVAVDEATGQRALDAVRGAGGVVTGYKAASRTLEEVFIQDITGKDAAAAPEKGQTR
ncbi:MAG TPA: ABC transporter ATP-binding protein [Candidatus Krumholzibacteria bacterium]|nr:ABC transporter ATP-binding protein [Candidatus Krumholzibacteria bacterium]